MGLGFIGQELAKAAIASSELEIVSALDLDSARVGRSLPDVLGVPAPDLKVTSDLTAAFHRAAGGLLLHATGSRLEKVATEIEAAIGAGMAVVSTCEELSYPWLRNQKLAEKLDRLAQKKKVAVLGGGVNPGFVLDRLIATLGAATGRVDKIRGVRVVDARTRRLALQRKIGAGLSPDNFDEKVDNHEVGHVGLMESAAMAALGVGLEVDEVDEEIEPFLATADVEGAGGIRVAKGGIAGIFQVARAFKAGREVCRLELTIALGAPDPRDEIELHGDPPLRCVFPGGVPGDRATVWSLIHAAPLVRGAQPGLMTVLDLPAGR